MSVFFAILAAQILDPARIILVAVTLLVVGAVTSPTKWIVPTVVAVPCVSAAMVLVLEAMKETQGSGNEMVLRFLIGLASTSVIVIFFRLITRPFRY